MSIDANIKMEQGFWILHHISERSQLSGRYVPEVRCKRNRGEYLFTELLCGRIPSLHKSHVSQTRHTVGIQCFWLL